MKQLSVIGLIILLSTGIAAYAEKEGVKEDIFLATRVVVDESRKEKYDWYDYYLQKISYRVDGKTKWTADLPERMTKKPVYKLYKEAPDFNKIYRPYYLHGLLYTEDILAIADETGVLLKSKKDGRTLADIATERSSDNRNAFFVDKGIYTIKIQGKTYKGRTYKRSSFLVNCESHLIFFNGLRLMIFDAKSYRLLENILFEKKHFLPGNGKLPEGVHKSRGIAKFMRIKAESCEVELAGMIYL